MSTRTDTLVPYTTLFRSRRAGEDRVGLADVGNPDRTWGQGLPVDGDRVLEPGRMEAGLEQTIGQDEAVVGLVADDPARSEEHTSELQSLMRISYAVFCLHKNKIYNMQ